MAAYETPVSDRIWVLTATGATPDLVLEELLDHLADGDGWDASFGAPVDEKAVTAATQPLSDAGWKHAVDGRWIRWTSPAGDAGVQFDAFAAQHPQPSLATWTVWAGPGPDRPTWTLTASPHTPSSLLAGLSENLVHGAPVFPPTVKVSGSDAAGYLRESRYVDGDQVEVVYLDQPQSQANRCEVALLDAVRRGELFVPHVEMRTEAQNMSNLEAPHRSRDAYFRDSLGAKGEAFDETAAGLAQTARRHRGPAAQGSASSSRGRTNRASDAHPRTPGRATA